MLPWHWLEKSFYSNTMTSCSRDHEQTLAARNSISQGAGRPFYLSAQFLSETGQNRAVSFGHFAGHGALASQGSNELNWRNHHEGAPLSRRMLRPVDLACRAARSHFS